MRMLKTFLSEVTTQSKTAFSFGTRLMVFRGRSTRSTRNDLITLRLLAAPFVPGLASPLKRKALLVKKSTQEETFKANLQNGKGNGAEGADDDHRIDDVPEVATVGARVEEDALINYLENHLHGEDARKGVIEVNW